MGRRGAEIGEKEWGLKESKNKQKNAFWVEFKSDESQRIITVVTAI